MTTSYTMTSTGRAANKLEEIGKALTTIFGSPYLASDMKVYADSLKRQYKEACDYGCKKYWGYNRHFFVREKGVEHDYERVKNHTVLAEIDIRFNEDDKYYEISVNVKTI